MRHQRKVLAVTCAVALVGCGTGQAVGPSGGERNPDGFPMTVTNCGRQVVIKHPPRHVFAERDTSTTVAAAGAANRIVARSGEGDVPLGRYRNQLSQIPQVTKNSSDPPSPEVIVGHHADLVVAGHVTRQDVQALEALDVPVIIPSWFCQQVFGSTAPVTFTDTYHTLRLFGKIFGTEHTARKVIADLKGRVGAIKRRYAHAKPRTAANLFVAPSMLGVYGRLSANNTVLNTLGLRNVFADTNQRSTDVSSESLVARNPDIVVLSFNADYHINNGATAKQIFRTMPGLGRLNAVREHRLITLNYSYLTGGPLTVDGLEMLADRLARLN